MNLTHILYNVISENRNRQFNILRKLLPKWPEYVIKEFFIDGRDVDSKEGWKFFLNHAKELSVLIDSWKLQHHMMLTFDMLDSETQNRMKDRHFGLKPYQEYPDDEDRSSNSEILIMNRGVENLPPIILINTDTGLDLWEGWHRTMAAFRLHPDGFKVNAWIGTPREGYEKIRQHSRTRTV